jgi:hypothetical protein
MKFRTFYRDVRARDHLELFLVFSIASLLLLRFFLYLTGYPQVGGGSLHIAHMLYGGLLMVIAIVMLLAFLGARIQRLSAIVGGIGFGIFIDELGKFITKDNNYFFRPTIGIIYAIFMSLYLIFNFISRGSKYSSREYQLNALNQFEEAVLSDLDKYEKAAIHRLLDRADQNSPITRELRSLLRGIDAVEPTRPNLFYRIIAKIDEWYRRFWLSRNSNQVVSLVLILQAVAFLGVSIYTAADNFADVSQLLTASDYASKLLIGELASSILAAVFIGYGAIRITSSRVIAFEQFRRATLINLFLTEFFSFSRIQFGAIPSFIGNLLLLAALQYVLYQEKRLQSISYQPIPK